MRRATDEAGRDERRRAILAAAEGLLREGDGGLPSVARIASAAGIAKGTIYLYFSTKEEILAALLHALWVPMLAAFEEELTQSARSVEDRAASFADRFASYCEGRQYLLRLDAILKEVIERNMTPDALAAHRAASLGSLVATSMRLEAALELASGRGYQIVTRTHAMVRGLWQSFGDPPLDLAHKPDHSFGRELREAVIEYLKGALS